MKNYIYSKILYQQLQEWEQWLTAVINIFNIFIKAQNELKVLKALFSDDSIAKKFPSENSEFEAF